MKVRLEEEAELFADRKHRLHVARLPRVCACRLDQVVAKLASPVTSDRVPVEIKGWHMEAISPSYLAEASSLFFFTRPEAVRAATELFGTNDVRNVLVVSRIGSQSQDVVRAHADSRGVEIIEFPEILNFLVDHVPEGMGAGSESEHVIRVLKIYGLIER
jgi:hypothetical protein